MWWLAIDLDLAQGPRWSKSPVLLIAYHKREWRMWKTKALRLIVGCTLGTVARRNATQALSACVATSRSWAFRRSKPWMEIKQRSVESWDCRVGASQKTQFDQAWKTSRFLVANRELCDESSAQKVILSVATNRAERLAVPRQRRGSAAP